MVKRVFLILGLIGLISLGLGFFWPFRTGSNVLRLPGVVEIQEVRLGSKLGGRVEAVETREGAIEPAGKVLVTFEAPELRAQRQQVESRLQQAIADFDKVKNGPRPEEKEAARAAVEAAKARWEVMKLGSRPEEIREARSQYESSESDLKLAKEEFDRAQRLMRTDAAARADWEVARANMQRAQAQVGRTKARLDLLEAGNRPQEIQQAAAELKRAQANYDLLLAGSRSEDIAEAEARVAEARGKLTEIDANLLETVVKAPEKVLVDVLAVRKGDLVPPNTPVLRVLRADDLWVRVYVPETELGKVRLNQPVTVTIDSYPNLRFDGTVMQIGSESEFTPRNVQSPDERRHQVFSLKVHVTDPQGIFKSGMAAEVTLPLE